MDMISPLRSISRTAEMRTAVKNLLNYSVCSVELHNSLNRLYSYTYIKKKTTDLKHSLHICEHVKDEFPLLFAGDKVFLILIDIDEKCYYDTFMN